MIDSSDITTLDAVEAVMPLTAAPPEVPVAQWVKRWPTDKADRIRSPLEAKSSHS